MTVPTYADLMRSLVLQRLIARLDAEWADVGEADWLDEYRTSVADLQPADLGAEQAASWWLDRLTDAATDEGPLGRLSVDSAMLLVAAGLIETDIRFGALFAALQRPLPARRPCIGLLAWLLSGPDQPVDELTRQCHDLVRRGVLQVENPTEPRAEWVLRVPVPVWDLVTRGRIDPASLPPQLSLRTAFPPLDDVAVGPAAARLVAGLPRLFAEGRLTAVLVRGMARSGRTTVLGSVASLFGLDVLRYDGDPADPAWQLFGALASMADVLPVVCCEPGPGETTVLPSLLGLRQPLGVVCGRSGSVAGPQLDHVVTVHLDACGPDDRRLLWRAAGLSAGAAVFDDVVERFLLTPGNILRAAPLAELAARGAGRDHVIADDVRAATRTLRRQELETLATWLEPLPASAAPVLGPSAAEELDTLVLRCRHRERLVAAGPPGLNRGVRALFTGPSGTGKTLAARHLGALLNLDLYRIDLAAVVNKYIGETERNLDRVLARAEELDVLLLLDEGDSLMTRRTDVSNANDRYANLETNFLLQRLETFDGIVIVTSNAAARIDPAFLRRIDVTVDFVPPDAELRWQIWSSHLPIDHDVDPDLLAEVARRCALTGGQIRNAALHASLLSLDNDEPVSSDELMQAVRREYRRAGATCPMTAPAQPDPASVAITNRVPSW